MGTGGSFLRHNDEDDVIGDEYETSHGVVKRIPIEVKPRGRLGIRSVKSLGKPKGSSSLRSALSVDLENPEVERIRKDFEMYQLNKENEMVNMQKNVQKLDTENRRLRAELQTLQKTCRKLREERDAALEAERQAFVRAMTFEGDRDKIQRQFKIFRETKETELRNLLKNRRDLESKLSRIGLMDTDSTSRLESTLGGAHAGDWWTALESESSLGSTTQLHTMALRGPEFAQTAMEMEGPYINVNKDDWQAVTAGLSQTVTHSPDSLQTNTINVYISAPSDLAEHVDALMQEHGDKLKKLCGREGRLLNLIYMPESDSVCISEEEYVHSRCRHIDQATIFLAFLGDQVDRFSEMDYNFGHLNSPGYKPAIFCFKENQQNSENRETSELKKKVRDIGSMRLVSNYPDAPQQGVPLAIKELEKALKIELDIDHRSSSDPYEHIWELDGPVSLCGGCLWDIHQDREQMETLAYAIQSSCELGFEKCYERLNAHIAAPGPLPPLLVSGLPGCGKSLLLAKWIELQQHRSSNSLVLFHFVGRENSISSDPSAMIRRLTAQLMQHTVSPPTLTCDPVRLSEEFPKWLEKVSSKLAGGVVLVLDSVDCIQNHEAQLKWLLDPLPVDSRIIVSVNEDTCPQSWKSWPTLHVGELSTKSVKELIRAELSSLGKSVAQEIEGRILTHCRSPAACCPLYVVLLASHIARCENESDLEKQLPLLLTARSSVQLYSILFDYISNKYECSSTKGSLKRILQLIYASRNGLSEGELFSLIPQLTWNQWLPLYDALADRHVVTLRSGLIIFAHQQAKDAVFQKYYGTSDRTLLTQDHKILKQYFEQFYVPDDISYRVADELPWLCFLLHDNEALRKHILNLCIFAKLYGRGRCGELVSYWLHVGVDKVAMATAYFNATKQMEEMVGHCEGFITLPKVADVFEALGRFLRDLGLLGEALTPLERSLELRETALDPDHPSVAQSLYQVAALHAQQAKFLPAEALYKQALEIYEGTFGREHFLVAKVLDALAILYQKQGRHDLAEPIHKQAVAIRKTSKAPRASSGQLRGADPLRRRVLHLEELAMGPDSADLARTLNEIGVLYYLQGNVDAAESFFKRSLEMREHVLSSDHPDLAQSLNNLAALYNDRKLYDKAEPLYERALESRKKHYPMEHTSVMSIVKHLAMLYKKMNKLDKAEPLYKHMVEARERHFSVNHPSVATALVNWAVLLSQLTRHESAQPLYERALKIYEDSFGSSHPRVAETLRNLALCKYEQGEYETAAKLYQRALDMKDEPILNVSKLSTRRSSSGEPRPNDRQDNR